jgi:hypothetical protein
MGDEDEHVAADFPDHGLELICTRALDLTKNRGDRRQYAANPSPRR